MKKTATPEEEEELPFETTLKPATDLTTKHSRNPEGGMRFPYRLPDGSVVYLTARHRKFVSEYLIDFDQKAAAIRAGYSPNSVKYGGRAIPSFNPDVKKAIEAEVLYQCALRDLTPGRIVDEWIKIVNADIRNVVDWDEDGIRLRPQKTVSPDVTSAIQVLDFDNKRGSVRLKMHDKSKALEALAKHQGMYRENNKRDIVITHEQLVLNSFKPLPQTATTPMKMTKALLDFHHTKDAVLVEDDDEGDDDERGDD